MEKRLKLILGLKGFERVPEKRSATMAAIKSKGNKTTELRFRLALVRSGVHGWKMHDRNLPGTPDFSFRQSRVVVFIDGCFWHGCPQCGHIPRTRSGFWRAKIKGTRERDVSKDRALAAAGYRVFRIWEHDVATKLSDCVGRVIAELRTASF